MAPTLDCLPPEILIQIVDEAFEASKDDVAKGYNESQTRIYSNLADEHAKSERFQVWRDVLNLAATSKYLRRVITPVVYSYDAKFNHSSALMLSAKTGNTAAITMALHHGADIHAGDRSTAASWVFGDTSGCKVWKPLELEDQVTALHWAAFKGHVPAAKLLMERGADVNHRVRVDTSVGMYRSIEIKRLAAKFMEVFPFPSKPVQHVAARIQEGLWGVDDSIMCQTLERGANPLYFALLAGHYEMAQLLIKAGASTETHLGTQVNALHQACDSGNVEMVKLILHRVDPNVADALGNTPLHYLSGDRQVAKEVLDLLMAKGADINAYNEDGETPLYSFYSRHEQQWNATIASCFLRWGSSLFQHFYHSFPKLRSSHREALRLAMEQASAAGLRNEEEGEDTTPFDRRHQYIHVWFYRAFIGEEPSQALLDQSDGR
ncbi:hypothetical protein ACHAPT_006186 [Fusarium lateritium]